MICSCKVSGEGQDCLLLTLRLHITGFLPPPPTTAAAISESLEKLAVVRQTDISIS